MLFMQINTRELDWQRMLQFADNPEWDIMQIDSIPLQGEIPFATYLIQGDIHVLLNERN